MDRVWRFSRRGVQHHSGSVVHWRSGEHGFVKTWRLSPPAMRAPTDSARHDSHLHAARTAAYLANARPSRISHRDPPMPSTISERYAALVGEGEIERDGAQEVVA